MLVTILGCSDKNKPNGGFKIVSDKLKFRKW